MARLLLAVERGDDRLALPALQGVLDRAAACSSPRQDGFPARGTGRSAVAMVRELLESPGEPDASLDHLARHAGVGRALLCRLFRRETGITINEYRTLARLRRVRGLLLRGSSLAGAAADAGFHDQSHMTIRFKKYMGMTPGLYARAAR
ncbi:helix-turn-helix transcriptional regulator [Fundidesulfovibrio terrae]|uniref:helix-turn-helix transcriptional regulator n=1 Tax=Fundidesulfovibrio terrae TaxID=2922866 RepID=UPI001FAEA15D|nr:helix-turn-helix transcriptional regulator [Fundidesulfovibrio terrae]